MEFESLYQVMTGLGEPSARQRSTAKDPITFVSFEGPILIIGGGKSSIGVT